MNDERRRYFRINDTVGISYQVLSSEEQGENVDRPYIPDVLDLVSQQDRKIEQLLAEVSRENPKVAELVRLFNQKLERVVSQIVVESHLVDRIAQRVKEANISACGIAFKNDEAISLGAKLKLELTLFPNERKILTNGYVVGCDHVLETDMWFVRIDFYSMTEQSQEHLIQHIVQGQSAQLKSMRGNS